MIEKISPIEENTRLKMYIRVNRAKEKAGRNPTTIIRIPPTIRVEPPQKP